MLLRRSKYLYNLARSPNGYYLNAMMPSCSITTVIPIRTESDRKYTFLARIADYNSGNFIHLERSTYQSGFFDYCTLSNFVLLTIMIYIRSNLS